VKAEIERWFNLIEKGVRYKENFGGAKNWSTYRAYGRGYFPGFTGATNGILPYNLVHAMQRGMTPNIYFRNPYINVTPDNQPSAAIQARIVEAVDNQLMFDLGIKQTFKTMVQDAYYTNRGIAKIGYDGLWSSRKPKGEEAAGILGIPLSQMDKSGKERIEYNVNVKPGCPWLDRVMPEMIVVPFGVRTLEDCPWIDHIVYRFLSDVKSDPKYKDTAELEGTHLEYLSKMSGKSQYYAELSSVEDIVEIHEVRDLKRREIFAFVPGYDQFIRPPAEDVLQVDGLPFVDFTFNEDGEYYWGPSDVQIIEPQQLEINETRTQAMYHRRIALLKFIMQEGGMDKAEAAKFLTESVGPVIWSKGKPTEIVTTLQPHIPPDLIQWTDVIRSDVRELLGAGRQQLGEAPPGRRTAEEMRQVQSAYDVRMDERRDIVADALTRAIHKINLILFERWDVEKVAQVVGYDGAKYWVAYKGTENKSAYKLRVDVESMTPRTKMMKRREIIELIQALGKNPRANIDYLMQMLLREYDWIDAMKVLPEASESMTAPMPQQQFMQQQNQLLQNPKEMQARTQANAQRIGGVM
jgi:hypothetical protein